MTKTAEEVSESVAGIPQELLSSQRSVLVAGRGALPVPLWASLIGREGVTVASLSEDLMTLDFSAAWLA